MESSLIVFFYSVMGDTSSGKSALLASISMVELPSNAKLTTRCPIRLEMKQSQERSASVSIVWKDDQKRSEFGVKHVNKDSWDKLTGYIVEAQDHIIKVTGKEVSRHVVSVLVTGPLCEGLTLVNLPGIVRSTGAGESESLSDDIQQLINEYLHNPRCVVLAVLPANVDFHNSQIMRDAKKVDPNTTQTLPVLTKPDLIDAGGEEGVKELLLGFKAHEYSKGFHMVKGRGQAALDKKQTIAQGLQDEETFFERTEPWSNVQNRKLFGTKELCIKLCELQMDLVRETFPDIVDEIKTKKAAAEQQLEKMGIECESLPKNDATSMKSLEASRKSLMSF